VELARYLERLEAVISPDVEEAGVKLQEDAWAYLPVPRIPRIINLRDKVSKERKGEADWPVFTYSEVFADPGCMLLDELEDIYVGALVGDDKAYTIRANYGVGIIPSVFGCQVHTGGSNDLPWVEPLTDETALRRLLGRGVPNLDQGLLARATETEQFFQEALAPYPKLSQAVHIAQADMQGPLNIASEIMGPAIYTAIYDDPAMVHDLLDLTTETFIAATRQQKGVIGEEMNRAYHWHLRTYGGARISEDFGLSLSPKHYEEFAVPYNARCWAAFGGGYLLHADAGLPAIEAILATPGITGIYRWTEDASDFDRIWPLASARRICLIWNGPLPDGWEQRAPTGLILESVVQCVEQGKQHLRAARS